MVIEASLQRQQVARISGALNFLTVVQISRIVYANENACVFDGESYDYIIVGGGTAGCIVASRLVEDNKTTVLLIEAGHHPVIVNDFSSLMWYSRSIDRTWKYQVEDPGLTVKHSLRHPHADIVLGKSLGGSSCVGYSQYSSGSKHDYNDWAKRVNDPIWNWQNILPYIKKSQRLITPSIIKADGEFYGQDGTTAIRTYGKTANYDNKMYLKMFEDIGYDIVPSVNGNNSLGYTECLLDINENGIRQNTALTYLLPKLEYPNLQILKNTTVYKILFDSSKRAIGVKAYVCNNRTVIIKAKREVILSAGVVNTPKLLMLSGIGPKEHLCKHKIHTISNLSVGEGFQDQLGIQLSFNMTNTVTPYKPPSPYEYPAPTIMGYVTLNKSKDYPDYQAANYVAQPTICMDVCVFPYNFNDSICNNFYGTSVNSINISINILKQRFKSRGRVLLRSNDFRDDPIIYSGYNSDPEDLESHAENVMDYVKVTESKTFKKLGGQVKDPGLSKCGKMDLKSKEYWKCYVQYMSVTHHKYCGTCAFGTVVDSRLRVYGVNNIRVVDASVIPNPTLGGTLGPTMVIGEKAAVIIAEDRDKLN